MSRATAAPSPGSAVGSGGPKRKLLPKAHGNGALHVRRTPKTTGINIFFIFGNSGFMVKASPRGFPRSGENSNKQTSSLKELCFFIDFYCL
jgi:hypothetical protein